MNRFVMGLILIVFLAAVFFYVWRKSTNVQLNNFFRRNVSPAPSANSGFKTNPIVTPPAYSFPSASPLIPQYGQLPATGL